MLADMYERGSNVHFPKGRERGQSCFEARHDLLDSYLSWDEWKHTFRALLKCDGFKHRQNRWI